MTLPRSSRPDFRTRSPGQTQPTLRCGNSSSRCSRGRLSPTSLRSEWSWRAGCPTGSANYPTHLALTAETHRPILTEEGQMAVDEFVSLHGGRPVKTARTNREVRPGTAQAVVNTAEHRGNLKQEVRLDVNTRGRPPRAARHAGSAAVGNQDRCPGGRAPSPPGRSRSWRTKATRTQKGG